VVKFLMKGCIIGGRFFMGAMWCDTHWSSAL